MARKPKSEAPSSRIALLREERGWSQADLAEKMFITQKTVSEIENGRCQTMTNYIQVAEIFDVSLDYIIGRTDEKYVSKTCIPDIDARIINMLRGISENDKEKILKHLEIEYA